MNYQTTSASARPRVAVPHEPLVKSTFVPRQGSLDFAKCPSVVNGKTVVYTPVVGVSSTVSRYAYLGNSND